MIVDWSKLLDWVRLPPKLLFALAAICGVLVFSSVAFLQVLGLNQIVESLRGWIGLGFVAFSVLLTSHFLDWFFSLIRPWIKEWVFIRLHRKRLHQLDAQEKQLIANYLENDTRTLRLDPKDGTATVLCREHILAVSAHIGDLLGISYAIQPWAWEYLKEHPDLLAPYLNTQKHS